MDRGLSAGGMSTAETERDDQGDSEAIRAR